MSILGREISPNNHAAIKMLGETLGKVTYAVLDTNDNRRSGKIENQNGSIIVYLNDRLTGEPFEAAAAHQLLHAVQSKENYPNVCPASPDAAWQNVLAESLGDLVLDLKVMDDLNAMGFDNTYFINRRYKEIKDFTTRIKAYPLDSFQKLWFSLDLALAIIFLPAERVEFLLSGLHGKEDLTVGTALKMISVIEKIGYSTPGRAFIALAELNCLIHMWEHLHIQYENALVTSNQQYQSQYAGLRKLVLG